MIATRSLSLRALLWCLEKEIRFVDDASIPDTHVTLTDIMENLLVVVDAARNGRIAFTGRLTETDFLIDDDAFGHRQEARFRKAARLLSLPDDEGYFQHRTLGTRATVPSEHWQADTLVPQMNILLLVEDDPLRALHREASVPWQTNPHVEPPEYSTASILAYEELECRVEALDILRRGFGGGMHMSVSTAATSGETSLSDGPNDPSSVRNPKGAGSKRKYDRDEIVEVTTDIIRKGWAALPFDREEGTRPFLTMGHLSDKVFARLVSKPEDATDVSFVSSFRQFTGYDDGRNISTTFSDSVREAVKGMKLGEAR